MEIFNKFEWAKDAKYFSEVLQGMKPNQRTMVLLRHSQRTEPKIWEEIMKAPLTPDGIDVAQEFGATLPRDRSYRIYHSRIDRCRQTADAIKNGYSKKSSYESSNPSSLSIVGYLPVLTEFYMQPNKFQEFTERDGLNFVRNWLANHYSPDISESALTYSQRAAHDLLTIHFQGDPTTTDIFISHDFNILVWRSLWAGLFPDGDWISYLGGFIIQLGENRMSIYYNQTKEDVYYPHWWKTITGLPF